MTIPIKAYEAHHAVKGMKQKALSTITEKTHMADLHYAGDEISAAVNSGHLAVRIELEAVVPFYQDKLELRYRKLRETLVKDFGYVAIDGYLGVLRVSWNREEEL